MSYHRAVFLDRDGVLVVPLFRDGRSFAPTKVEEFVIYQEAPECVARLKRAGFRIVVVTNQPDVGAGRVEREIVEEMNARLSREVQVDAIKVCYHTSRDNCACRKPLPGMLLDAAKELDIDLSASIMVGDRASDIDAGARAGCRTAFINLNYTAEAQAVSPDIVVGSLGEATNWILSSSGSMRALEAERRSQI
jgi:D-glycero-D-manno-heptose 1,7-bisphosphate phosphatase